MKLSILLAALAISYTSLVKSTPVLIPTNSGSNPTNIAGGSTISSGSWEFKNIGTELDPYYKYWEKKPLGDIEKQAIHDEADANRLVGKIQTRERAADHMLRSFTLRFYRTKMLVSVDVAVDEISRLKIMAQEWNFVKGARLEFIGLYVSHINLVDAYKVLLHSGTLPPYTAVAIIPDTFYSDWARGSYKLNEGTGILVKSVRQEFSQVSTWFSVIQSCYSKWEKFSDEEIKAHVNEMTRKANKSPTHDRLYLHMIEVLLMRLILYRRHHIGREDDLKCLWAARTWPELKTFADSLIGEYGATVSSTSEDLVSHQCTYVT